MQPQGPYGPAQPPYTPASPPSGQPGPYGQAQPPAAGPAMPSLPPLSGPAGAPQPVLPGQPSPVRPAVTGAGLQQSPTFQSPTGSVAPSGQPGQPGTEASAGPETPYDFFMQPKPPINSTPLPVTGRRIGNKAPGGAKTMGQMTKILVFAAGGGTLLVLIVLLVAALMPKDQTGAQLLGIAQTQQELIRVCTQGTSKAQFQSTRNFAVTCSTATTTSQRQLLGYMAKIGATYDPKQLGLKASAQTDNRLNQAASSSNYDATFREVAKLQLAAYDQAITNQLARTSGVNGRETLTKNQRSASLLLQMVADDADKTEAASDATSSE